MKGEYKKPNVPINISNVIDEFVKDINEILGNRVTRKLGSRISDSGTITFIFHMARLFI